MDSATLIYACLMWGGSWEEKVDVLRRNIVMD